MRMFNNKKGQIPTTDIVGSVINGIRSAISWFFTTIPKPLLAIIFLFFILLIGNFLIPAMANTFGYHCDSNGQVWKVSGLAVFDNLDLLRHKPEYSEGDLQAVPFMCFAKQTARHLSYCSNCTFNSTAYGSCQTDGYRLDDYSGFKNFYCNTLGCAPPIDYFLDISAEAFRCDASWCINATLDAYNSNIYQTEGASPVYQNIGANRTAEGAIYFKCKEENPLNIRLTLFGIDMFDYRVWVALFMIGIILYGYTLIK